MTDQNTKHLYAATSIKLLKAWTACRKRPACNYIRHTPDGTVAPYVPVGVDIRS